MNPISVLLVDDNAIFLRIAARFLQAHDEVVVVGTADGGKEALAKAQDLQPQVVLLDLAMPDLPGLETIPRLRSLLPDVGIIVLTLLDTDGYRKAALAAGADNFIPKTLMDTDLLPAIRRMIRTDQRREEMDNTDQEKDSMTGQRILVLEDDTYLRRLYSKALCNRGYRVNSAATIGEARDRLANFRFDVFLCDIHIGDNLGTELLREQQAVLSQQGTQVIVVSGKAQYRAMCEEMGVDFYLEKPVTLATLLTMVDRLTAQR